MHFRFLLLFAIPSLAASPVRAGYVTHFTTLPYPLDDTVLGVDGWQPRLLSEKTKAVSSLPLLSGETMTTYLGSITVGADEKCKPSSPLFVHG